MFTSWAELTLNDKTHVSNRLEWMRNRTAPGLMAVGKFEKKEIVFFFQSFILIGYCLPQERRLMELVRTL
jgi:hypothetical protein